MKFHDYYGSGYEWCITCGRGSGRCDCNNEDTWEPAGPPTPSLAAPPRRLPPPARLDAFPKPIVALISHQPQADLGISCGFLCSLGYASKSPQFI